MVRAQGFARRVCRSSRLSAARSAVEKEIDLLVRRLARAGFWNTGSDPPKGGNDQVVIEPQMPDYWPQIAKLGRCRKDRAVAVRVSAAARQ